MLNISWTDTKLLGLTQGDGPALIIISQVMVYKIRKTAKNLQHKSALRVERANDINATGRSIQNIKKGIEKDEAGLSINEEKKNADTIKEKQSKNRINPNVT